MLRDDVINRKISQPFRHGMEKKKRNKIVMKAPKNSKNKSSECKTRIFISMIFRLFMFLLSLLALNVINNVCGIQLEIF